MPNAPVHHKEFDTLVHIRDKFGNLVDENHYALHFVEGTPYYERPITSGNLWHPNGEPAGRLTDRSRLVVELGAEHVEYIKPLTGTEKISAELNLAREKNTELLRELEALKLEQAKDAAAEKVVAQAKAAPAVPAQPSKFAAHEKKG